MESVRLLFCPARSHKVHTKHVHTVENILSMVAKRLTCHHTPVTTVDEPRNSVEAAWESVPVHAIQFLFESMPTQTYMCC
ncbi:hypothetical protein TNCV_4579901 [Trichonephila clavipes]|nr:hypothetical protein TNCV_4579901 [Trichonephila clavipes]